jgi:hypothetical protein
MMTGVRTRSSISQVSQFKSRRPDASHHGPDARVSNMEIACIDQPSRRPSSWSGRAKPLYGNYLQRTCDRPDDNATPSERASQTGKIFSKIFGISVAQLSIWTAYDHRPDGAQFYQAKCSFELSAYK